MGTPNLGLLLCSEPRPEAVAGHVGGGGAVFATGQLDHGRPEGAEGETRPALQTSARRKEALSKKNLSSSLTYNDLLRAQWEETEEAEHNANYS